MSRFPDCLRTAAALAAGLGLASGVCAADTGRFGLGVEARPEQIAGWDIDVRPDGRGLPPGGGSVEDGEWLYEEKCALCHGAFGESVQGYPALAGGQGSLAAPRPNRTVGSYWPYASTLWDYIHRAMPFAQPESLGDDEVYAIAAYVLYLNDIVAYDFVLTRDNLASVTMPNAGNFVAEERPDTNNIRCMRNCKDPASIEVRSQAPLYVPEGGGDARYPGSQPVAADAVRIAKGREIAADRSRGNCFSCHWAEGAEMAGNAGPPLVEMRLRYRERADLRAQIADPRRRNPETVMPPYGAHGILTTHELELVVDYVHSL